MAQVVHLTLARANMTPGFTSDLDKILEKSLRKNYPDFRSFASLSHKIHIAMPHLGVCMTRGGLRHMRLHYLQVRKILRKKKLLGPTMTGKCLTLNLQRSYTRRLLCLLLLWKKTGTLIVDRLCTGDRVHVSLLHLFVKTESLTSPRLHGLTFGWKRKHVGTKTEVVRHSAGP